MTIAEAKALPDNSAVRICNVIVNSEFDSINSGSVKTFRAQDATGGVTVFGSNAIIDPLLAQFVEGDSITIEGTTDFFNGLFELVDSLTVEPLTLISNNGFVGVPAPDVITAADLADGNPTAEFLESRLVRINCVLFTTMGTFTGGSGASNYPVIDATGQTVVRISRSDQADIVGQPIPTEEQDIIGLVGQNDTVDPRDAFYQIFPRTISDFIVNGVCPTPEAPPTATGGSTIGYRNTNASITLTGAAGNLPGATARFRIKSLPSNGTLNEGGPTITTVPHTLAGNTVTYVPNTNVTGLDQFNFDVWNNLAGANERFSAEATQRVAIQNASVFISEIMANPTGGNDFDPMNPQEEWIEIYNPTALAVALGHIGDSATPTFPINTNGNLEQEGTVIPANSAMVIAHSHSTTSPASNEAYLCCWGLTDSASQVQFIRDRANTGIPPADWKGLNNAGDNIYLYDLDGGLLDVVPYRGDGSWQPDNGFGSAALVDFGGGLNSTANDNGANWLFHDPAGGFEGVFLFGMYDSCAEGAANDASIKHDRGSPLYIEGLTEPPTPEVPPASSCPAGVPAATVTGVTSRKACDLSDTIAPFKVTDSRQGGATEVRIGFDTAPGGGGTGWTLEQATCAAPAFVAYSGASVVSGSVVGNELVLTAAPGLENARTYRVQLGATITSIPGLSVDVRGLIGDTNSDGAVNATDRSVVVSAWTGGGFSCPTDLNNDNATNATDRSIVVSAWTGGPVTNCAP